MAASEQIAGDNRHGQLAALHARRRNPLFKCGHRGRRETGRLRTEISDRISKDINGPELCLKEPFIKAIRPHLPKVLREREDLNKGLKNMPPKAAA